MRSALGRERRQYAQDVADATEAAMGTRRMLHSLIDNEYDWLCAAQRSRHDPQGHALVTIDDESSVPSATTRPPSSK